MTITHHIVPLEQVAPDVQPHCLLQTRDGQKWIVPMGPLLDADPDWTISTKTQQVLIPMHAYTTNEASPAAALGLALAIGTRAALAVTHNGDSAPPKRMHIAIGDAVEDLRAVNEDRFRFHIGLAFQTG